MFSHTHTTHTAHSGRPHGHTCMTTHTSFLATCQAQHPAYVLAAIWRVLSLQYTHCPPSHTRPTCIASRQPHATTHSHWSDVRPWNTTAGSVVIWLLWRYLLRHTHKVSTFARSACWRAPSEACSWHTYAPKGAFVVPSLSFDTGINLQPNIRINQIMNMHTHQYTHSWRVCLAFNAHQDVEGACVLSLRWRCEDMYYHVLECIRVCSITRSCTCLCTFEHVGLYVCMDECEIVCMYVGMMVCMYLCVFVCK